MAIAMRGSLPLETPSKGLLSPDGLPGGSGAPVVTGGDAHARQASKQRPMEVSAGSDTAYSVLVARLR